MKNVIKSTKIKKNKLKKLNNNKIIYINNNNKHIFFEIISELLSECLLVCDSPVPGVTYSFRL